MGTLGNAIAETYASWLISFSQCCPALAPDQDEKPRQCKSTTLSRHDISKSDMYIHIPYATSLIAEISFQISSSLTPGLHAQSMRGRSWLSGINPAWSRHRYLNHIGHLSE
jgi:hypothetical protein